MAAWLSSAALDAALAYAAALFGAGYAGGGGTASPPCACLWATRLAAQSRAIAPMSPLPIIAAAGCAACTGVSAELPHTPPVTWCRAAAVVSERWRGWEGWIAWPHYPQPLRSWRRDFSSGVCRAAQARRLVPGGRGGTLRHHHQDGAFYAGSHREARRRRCAHRGDACRGKLGGFGRAARSHGRVPLGPGRLSCPSLARRATGIAPGGQLELWH